MKKAFVYLLSLIILISLTSFAACAEENVYDEEYFTDRIFSLVGDDVREVLDDMGINSLDVEDIFSVSFKQIAEYFSDDLISSFNSCISDFIIMLFLIVASGVVNSFFIDSKKQNIMNIFSATMIILILVNRINPLINMLITTMKLNGDFILAFIPIFTLVISLSGTAVSAVTYSTISLAVSEFISFFINNFAVDLIGAYICISISFSLNRLMNINRFINLVNKAVNMVLGFVSGGFAALLSIRGILSASVDSVSSKSIRFLLSSIIPVVGSSISDAYSSLIGSINLIKGSLAVIAIIVILILSIPSVLEGAFFCICFTSLSYISEVFECEQLSGVFRAFCSAVRALLLLCILEIFILMISTGIMLSLKGAI